MIIKSKYNLCLLIILLIAFGCSTGAPDKQPDTGPKVNDKFESMGQSSDRLLNFMAIAYKSNLKNMVMKEKQVFTCANLNTEDLDYEKGKGKFKIFLESEDGSEAAELFVNFNFKSNEIWLSEKDMDYREPLLKLLSI